MTVFTSDYIAYIALILGVVLYVLSLYFKKATLDYMAATCWVMLAIYLSTVPTSTMIATFIIVSMLFGLLCIGTAISFRPKKEKAQEIPKMTSDEYTEHLRAMRYGKRSGYDKTGNKVSGW
jgi:hypothetical protein